MPRGVYDRKPKGTDNGHQAATVEDYEPIESDDEESSTTFTLNLPPLKSDDNGLPWGNPYEIDAHDIHSPLSPGRWESLYDDARLRLEKTPASKAIAYPFAEQGTAKRARAALMRYFKRDHGDGYARTFERRNPPRVIVQRGPNYRTVK